MGAKLQNTTVATPNQSAILITQGVSEEITPVVESPKTKNYSGENTVYIDMNKNILKLTDDVVNSILRQPYKLTDEEEKNRIAITINSELNEETGNAIVYYAPKSRSQRAKNIHYRLVMRALIRNKVDLKVHENKQRYYGKTPDEVLEKLEEVLKTTFTRENYVMTKYAIQYVAHYKTYKYTKDTSIETLKVLNEHTEMVLEYLKNIGITVSEDSVSYNRKGMPYSRGMSVKKLLHDNGYREYSVKDKKDKMEHIYSIPSLRSLEPYSNTHVNKFKDVIGQGTDKGYLQYCQEDATRLLMYFLIDNQFKVIKNVPKNKIYKLMYEGKRVSEFYNIKEALIAYDLLEENNKEIVDTELKAQGITLERLSDEEFKQIEEQRETHKLNSEVRLKSDGVKKDIIETQVYGLTNEKYIEMKTKYDQVVFERDNYKRMLEEVLQQRLMTTEKEDDTNLQKYINTGKSTGILSQGSTDKNKTTNNQSKDNVSSNKGVLKIYGKEDDCDSVTNKRNKFYNAHKYSEILSKIPTDVYKRELNEEVIRNILYVMKGLTSTKKYYNKVALKFIKVMYMNKMKKFVTDTENGTTETKELYVYDNLGVSELVSKTIDLVEHLEGLFGIKEINEEQTIRRAIVALSNQFQKMTYKMDNSNGITKQKRNVLVRLVHHLSGDFLSPYERREKDIILNKISLSYQNKSTDSHMTVEQKVYMDVILYCKNNIEEINGTPVLSTRIKTIVSTSKRKSNKDNNKVSIEIL